MYVRFLTYDLNSASSEKYQDLYDLLNTYEYKQITESTYQISTNEDWETFKRKFYRVTRTNDNVKAIVLYNGAMDVRTIR